VAVVAVAVVAIMVAVVVRLGEEVIIVIQVPMHAMQLVILHVHHVSNF
jgi:hypothetical protein